MSGCDRAGVTSTGCSSCGCRRRRDGRRRGVARQWPDIIVPAFNLVPRADRSQRVARVGLAEGDASCGAESLALACHGGDSTDGAWNGGSSVYVHTTHVRLCHCADNGWNSPPWACTSRTCAAAVCCGACSRCTRVPQPHVLLVRPATIVPTTRFYRVTEADVAVLALILARWHRTWRARATRHTLLAGQWPMSVVK